MTFYIPGVPEGERKGEEGRVGEWGDGEGREEGGEDQRHYWSFFDLFFVL